MISPEYQQNVSQETIRLMQNLEEDVMRTINKPLVVDTDDVFAWQRNALSQTENVRRELLELVENATPDVLDEMRVALDKAGYKIVNDNEPIFQEAIKKGFPLTNAPPVDKSQRLLNILLAFQNVTEDEIKTINRSLVASAGNDYVRIVNESVARVLVGDKTLDVAVRESVNKLAKDGIQTIEKGGKTYNVDSAINMTMRTQTNNVAIDMQDERMKEYGHSIIEVSQHADARTLCARDQGKLYDKNNEINGYFRGEYITPFSNTSFGEPAGLFGVNCRHTYQPFFPGLSERVEKVAPMEEIKLNAKQRDKQRYLERMKRNAKRELAAAESRQDEIGIQRAKAKISKRNKELQQFTKQTGRTRRYNREQI